MHVRPHIAAAATLLTIGLVAAYVLPTLNIHTHELKGSGGFQFVSFGSYGTAVMLTDGDDTASERQARHPIESRLDEQRLEAVGIGRVIAASEPSDEAEARDDVHPEQDPAARSQDSPHLSDAVQW